MATKNNPSSTRTCLCSPTTHPGSFRCSLHRASRKLPSKTSSSDAHINRVDSKSMWVASKTNLIKAFLMQIIKPSSHDLQRRRNFQPKPSRFCQINTHGHDHHHGVAVS